MESGPVLRHALAQAQQRVLPSPDQASAPHPSRPRVLPDQFCSHPPSGAQGPVRGSSRRHYRLLPQLFIDREGAVVTAVGPMRARANREPRDRLLRELIGELSTVSAPFSSQWADATSACATTHQDNDADNEQLLRRDHGGVAQRLPGDPDRIRHRARRGQRRGRERAHAPAGCLPSGIAPRRGMESFSSARARTEEPAMAGRVPENWKESVSASMIVPLNVRRRRWPRRGVDRCSRA
jgi:hypothetical protein